MGFCSTPRSALELREHPGRGAELVEQPQAPERVGTGDEQAQLGELALAGRLARAPGGRARKPGGVRVDVEAELGAEPGGAQDPQRVGLEAALGDGPQQPRVEVGDAAVRDRSAR